MPAACRPAASVDNGQDTVSGCHAALVHPFTASMPASTAGEILPLRASSAAATRSRSGRRQPRTHEAAREAARDERGLTAQEAAPLALSPGARILWRAARVTQWELAGRALIVDGADSADIAMLLDAQGADDGEIRRVRAELQRAGFLSRPSGGIGARPRQPGRAASMLAAMPERLLADLHALAPRFGDDAATVLGMRRTRAVQVIGADRMVGMVAALLAAAGIGRIELPVPGAVRLDHAMPGGLSPADEGRGWSEAAAEAVRRAAPEAEIGAPPTGAAPDLVVVVSPRPMADELRDELHAASQPYLCLGVDGAHAVVGPMVVPGWSSCVQCLELHRRDRDPAWWALAAQLSTSARRTAPSDVALCTIAAGFAVSQALSLLDGEHPTTLDATVEMTLPDWRMRRRTRLPHPECQCMSG